jgi:hypothetical protein
MSLQWRGSDRGLRTSRVSEDSTTTTRTGRTVKRVRRRVPRDTHDVERSLVERVVGVEDERLVVLSSVEVEQQLREEGEVLRVPIDASSVLHDVRGTQRLTRRFQRSRSQK